MITREDVLQCTNDNAKLQEIIDKFDSGCHFDYYATNFMRAGCGNYIYKRKLALRFKYCPHCGFEIRLTA